MREPVIFIGANALVIEQGNVLMGRRINTSGHDTWGFPGGHVEKGERLREAAIRELKEETGLVAEEIEFLGIVNQPQNGQEKNHYLHVNFVVTRHAGEVMNCEPDRCAEWKWFPVDALPENIFPAHKDFVKAYVDKIALIEE